jgi:glycosyltransferase involved in cell wall biosynthesis
MKIDQPLLFVSYRLGESKFGGVMSEYAEDKIRIANELGIKTYVVTSLDSVPIQRSNVKYYRVPCLSFIELMAQIKDLRECNQKLPLQFFLILPLAMTVGFLFDNVLKFLFKSSFGGGFWSWPITALPVVIYLKIKYRIKNLLATGSASSGILGALTHLMTGIKFYYEVPDPIVGVTMNYSKKRLSRIVNLESFIIHNSAKTIFNTKFAAALASSRCPENADKITSLYPGAWKFNLQNIPKLDNKITFIHVGSLYGSRNLDLFLKAVTELEELGFITAEEIRIINIGAVHLSCSEYYLSNFEFIFLPEQKRESALEIANSASVLLLIQHKDLRSQETIPFKLYDYLNLQLPILGLIDNHEIENILVNYKNFLAPTDDLASIKYAIMECVNNVRIGFVPSYRQFNASDQFLEIFTRKY